MKKQTLSAVALLFALLVLLSSCGSKNTLEEDPGASADSGKITRLGQEFVDEVNVLLQYRESSSQLRRTNTVYSNDQGTYNIQFLLDFHDNYQAGRPAELISVIDTTSFIVTKVLFDGDEGYYYRYEYDAQNPDNIDVTGYSVESVELVREESMDRIKLILEVPKKSPVVLTYKNVRDHSAFSET